MKGEGILYDRIDDTDDVQRARQRMNDHVEALYTVPEWLRPELRALLHEGRLT